MGWNTKKKKLRNGGKKPKKRTGRRRIQRTRRNPTTPRHNAIEVTSTRPELLQDDCGVRYRVDPLTGVTTAAEPWCTSCGYPPSMCDPYYTRCRETIIGPWVDENGVYHESTTSAPNTEDLGECLPLARTHEVRDDPMDNMYDDDDLYNDLYDDDLYDDDDDDKKKIVRRGKCKDEIRNNNKFKDPPPPPPPQAMSVRSK